MPDIAHEMTEDVIKEAEKKVAREYNQARKEVQKKLNDYLAKMAEDAEEMRERYLAGEITKKDYADWMLRKTAMGKRWEEMRDNLAQDYHNANQIAKSITKGYQPEVYALNHNYATYQVEHDGGIDSAYTLYDKQTVERLIREDQVLMPEPSPRKRAEIARNKDMQWNKHALQSAMTQSILQGESIPEIARRVSSTVAVKNYNSAVRYARTMYTSTENAGRYDGYRRAQKMGIDLTIEWSATLDGRTRHDHRLMHGQSTEVDKPFNLPDGHKIYYPADCTGESDAPQREIWNCRCTLLAWVNGYERDTVKSSPKMGEMTFEEWQNEKAPKAKSEPVQAIYGNAIEMAPKKYKQHVMDALDAAPDNAKAAWNAVSADMHKPEFDAKSGKAHFAPWDGRTHYGSQKKAFQKSEYQEENACYFHEYGHNIDWLLGKKTTGQRKYLTESFEGGSFGETIYKECGERMQEFWMHKNGYKDSFDAVKSIQDGDGGMGISGYMRSFLRQSLPRDEYRALRNTLTDGDEHELRAIWDKYLAKNSYVAEDLRSYMKLDTKLGDEFRNHICSTNNIYQITDVSDLFEQYMIDNYKTNYPFGIGHGNNYWKRDKPETPYVSLGMEGFAEMYSATVTQNQSLPMIKELFPKSYAMFERMLEEAVK